MTILVMFLVGSVVVASLATVIHALLAKHLRRRPLHEHNEVTAAVYATFGVLYAVILGLLVSHGQTRRDVVAEASVRESALLVDIAQVSRSFDSTTSASLTQACLQYADHVRTAEWHAPARNNPGRNHRSHFEQMWTIARTIQPRDAREEAVFLALLDMLSDLATERYERLAATGDHISMFLKVVLLLGAFVTVTFLWLFGVNNHGIHLIYTWLVSFMLTMVLGLIFALDNPMRPGVGVRSDDFERASHELRVMLK